MNPVNPYGDIDLTSYLQTEGRKLAAELALKQGSDSAAEKAHPVIRGNDHGGSPVQQDAAHNPSPPVQEQQTRAVRQAGSLTEVLQQMGVTGSGKRGTR